MENLENTANQSTVLWSNRDTSVPQEQAEFDLKILMDNMDMDFAKKGETMIVGTLQRWDASHRVYKGTGQKSLSGAVRSAMDSFEPWDSFEIRMEEGELRLYQWGHDNPTNPSVMNIRVTDGTLADVEEAYEEAVESGVIPPKSSMVDFLMDRTSPVCFPDYEAILEEEYGT